MTSDVTPSRRPSVTLPRDVDERHVAGCGARHAERVPHLRRPTSARSANPKNPDQPFACRLGRGPGMSKINHDAFESVGVTPR